MLDINEAFSRYGQSLIDGDHKETIDFIYPKLFQFVPKEAITKSLKAGQNNPSVKISFDDFQLASIEKTHEVWSTSYVLFTSRSKVVMVYKPMKKSKQADADEESSEEEFMYEVLAAKHGKANVKHDKNNNTIRANTTSKLLGIKEEGNWYFLDVKPNLIELYKKFLPAPVVIELQELFPQEVDVPIEIPATKKSSSKKSAKSQQHQQPYADRIYLAGWDVHLNGDRNCEDFIATQITTKETVEKLYSGIELVFEDNKLVKAFDYDEGKKKERHLSDDEIGLPYKAFPLNYIYQFEEDNRGKHQLGGEVPKGFTLPKCNSVVPFQYLGYISNEDDIFNWLPFKIHLACPIYLNVMNVFVDYSDPMNPTVINREEVEEADTSHDELDKDSEIVFDDANFSFVKAEKFSPLGNAGIPNWIQASDIPTCPKSGKLMKFLCQLNGGVPVKRSNVDDPSNYFDTMEFWGDGDLFVFFEPTSKVACYFIQNT
jgi:hypothetical protein